MPFIEVKAFEHRFEDDEKAAELIDRITRAMGETYGQEVADETEVVLTGVAKSKWGFGGKVRT